MRAVAGSASCRWPAPPASPLGPAGFAQGGGNLIYHGSAADPRPVMHVNHTYAIFWNGSGPSDLFDPGYKALMAQFLGDVGADSLGGHSLRTNVYSTTEQYTDGTGAAAAYDSTFAGSLTDTDPYPTGFTGCRSSDTTACLSDAQLRTELDSFLTANSLPRGLTNLYYLFTPNGVGSCQVNGGTQCSNVVFCAYHSFSGTGTSQFLYANMPYLDVPGCDKGQRPNNVSADAELSAVSHEGKETITDPLLNAWFDNQGFESSDKCNFEFGTMSGPAGHQYNQTINGHHYLIQQDWSNKDYAASRSSATAAALSDQLPVASYTTGPPAASRVIQFASTASDADGTVDDPAVELRRRRHLDAGQTRSTRSRRAGRTRSPSP